MYIRKSKTRVFNGKTYYSHRLVESIRQADGKVKQQTYLNLGSSYDVVAEADWPLLAERVGNILNGTEGLLPLAEELESEAQRLAHLVIKKHGEAEAITDKANPVYERIDIANIENAEVKSVGAEALSYETAKILKLRESLLEIGFNKKQCDLALASIIGRLLSPGSEVSTCSYLRNNSALDEVMGVDFSSLHKNQLYEISDLLFKHKEAIEEKLYQREKDLFKFDEVVTLYDLTNTYFEGESRGNDHAAFGRSKEKRSDCVLVTLALVLDGSGFPKKSHIFKGNVAEGQTLEQMVSLSSKEAIIVMDAGIATEDNITWLQDNGYKYLVASRKRNQDIPKDITGVKVKEDKENSVTAYIVDRTETEREMYCHSEARQRRCDAIKSKLRDRFTQALEAMSAGLSKKGCTKKYDKILERLGRLKEKNKLVAHLYKIEVTSDEAKSVASAITWEYLPDKQSKESGVYCIRTNQVLLSHDEIWSVYRMLNDIESAFRTLKTELGLRPIYHQKTERISGHIFISLLAYHILHSIRYQLKTQNIHDSWGTIIAKLGNHFRITTSMQKEDGKIIHIRKSMRPNPEQQRIYQVCNINPIPLQTVISTY